MDASANDRPGSRSRYFADRLGWPIARCMLILEGETDERLLKFAARLYRECHSRRLIGGDFAVFACGVGKDGGTHRIIQDFPVFLGSLQLDVDAAMKPLYHAKVLLDSDKPGREALGNLTMAHARCRRWRDAFGLRRRYPMTTREPRQLETQIPKMNGPLENVTCEIEDLLSLELLDDFAADMPRCVKRIDRHDGGHHIEIAEGQKSKLVEHVQTCAVLADVSGLVALLKAMRYYFGLDPDGDAAT